MFKEVAESLGSSGYLLRAAGAANFEQLYSDPYVVYRDNVDMLKLMDAGDAPIYVSNGAQSPGSLLGLILHHGCHALAVKARADEVGLASVGYAADPVCPLSDPSGEELTGFLLRHIR